MSQEARKIPRIFIQSRELYEIESPKELDVVKPLNTRGLRVAGTLLDGEVASGNKTYSTHPPKSK